MGSLVVKLDKPTLDKIKNGNRYSDIDILNARQGGNDVVLGELPMAYDVDAVKTSIRNILMWRVGENILRPEFGHNIHRSMYEQITDFNKERLAQEIQRALEENEPRITIRAVSVQRSEDDEQNNRLNVQVVYNVKGNGETSPEFTVWTSIEGR